MLLFLSLAFEKALQYYDTHNLPQTWDKAHLLGSESEDDEVSYKLYIRSTSIWAEKDS